MSESEYVDRTPLDDPAWVIALVEERDALRARVADLEGAVRDRVPTDAEVEAALRAWYGTTGPDVLKAWDKEVPEADRAVRRKWMAAALTAAYALLPAPAPGRDTDGGKDA